MLIRISHPLEQGLPLYPGTPSLSIIPYRTFEKGDASSSSTITFHTHSGTHIDAPRHFCPGGSTIADLLRAESIFTHVTILPLPMAGDTCIAARDLEPFLPQIQEGQAILIRTGDCLRRERDPGGYGAVHPWIHPGIADFLREHAPSLRLFGLDAISISSPAHREEGRECHRAFLCGSPNPPHGRYRSLG